MIPLKIYNFAAMTTPYVNIHTHRPTGHPIELHTSGIHPWDADMQEVRSLLPLPVSTQAIGETGLDFVRGPSREKQMEAFRGQLDLARKCGLPIVLHCVKAFEPVMKELAHYSLRAVIFHGFIGSPEQAGQAVRAGYYLSFGERTFSSPKTLGALRAAPLSQLFLETDQSDTPIETIYASAAEVRGITVRELKQATFENYKRIFGDNRGPARNTSCTENENTETTIL